MKPFAAFIKMQLNVNYGVSALKYRFTREKKKLWEPILIAAVIILSLLPLLVMYSGLMFSIFAAGMVIKQPEMVLAISFVLSQLMILFFGIFYIMGMFYFSKDLETFVPLPLKPYEVIGGKFAVVMVNEYLTSMPLLLPPIIIYGAGTGQGLLYWLKSLLMMLSAPVIPLAAAAILVMVMMRVVNLRRYKDLFAIIGGLAAFLISFGFSMFTQRMPENPKDIQNYFTGRTDLVNLIGSKYPPGMWAAKGLSGNGPEGLGWFLLFIAVCALLFILLLWLSNRIFYKALLAGQEVSRKKKNLTRIQIQKKFRKANSPVLAMTRREWKLLVRTPMYMLNGLAGSVIGPLILLSLVVAKKSDPELSKLFGVLHDPQTVPYIILGGLGVMLFTSGMNLVASTALSREGQTLWITKMIPVTAKQQVNAKLLTGLSVSAIGVVTTAAILLIFFKAPFLPVLAAVFTAMLASVPIVALNLTVDIFHPKLVWNSEQEAMKQNMNGLIGMLLSILILVVLGAMTAVLLIIKMPLPVVFIAIAAVSVIMGALSLMLLYAVARKKYREIEA